MSSSTRIYMTYAVAALVLFACGKTRSLGDGSDGEPSDEPSNASGGQPQVPVLADGGTFDEGEAQGGSSDEPEPEVSDPLSPLQGLRGPDNLPSCGARAISRDGTTAAGFCQSSNFGGTVSIGTLWNVDEPSMPTEIRSRSNVGAWVGNGDGSSPLPRTTRRLFAGRTARSRTFLRSPKREARATTARASWAPATPTTASTPARARGPKKKGRSCSRLWPPTTAPGRTRSAPTAA